MRTVFLGTSDFAVAVLEALAGGAHRPALVVTRPDRPRGRGRRLSPPPVARAARALGIELIQPERVNEEEGRRAIAACEPGAVVVCAYGALIREPLLSEHEMLNVHPSLLPRWRGAAPVERAIMAGDERTGVSIMRLTAGLDSGPVCLAAGEEIGAHDTYGTLSQRLQAAGGELLVQALDDSPPCIEQDPMLVTYAEKIGAEDRLLDPMLGAVELERVVRALHPHIGARLALNGRLLGVREARALEDARGVAAGALGREGERLLYGTARGALELLVVQPPGGRPMDAGAYMRGHAL
ncbi:MAG TPA: methionyl-tRNA formyltransferase [Solirubrobacteraceae bacterium]|nr:methionyl-tRNA formyltransferase [Solirubrobacteraceae bacterium]